MPSCPILISYTPLGFAYTVSSPDLHKCDLVAWLSSQMNQDGQPIATQPHHIKCKLPIANQHLATE